MSGEPSDSIMDLAKPKELHPSYKPARSAYTSVTEEAMSAQPSPRVVQLATPKTERPWYTNYDANRYEFIEPITCVSPSAKRASASPRVEALAEHKSVPSEFKAEKPVQWPVTDNAKNASASDRLQLLARPKSARLKTEDYDPYKVSNAAQSARASPRLTELSLPIPRKQRNKKS